MNGFKKTLIALALGGLSMSAHALPFNFYVDLTGTANGGGNLGTDDSVTGVKTEAGVRYDSKTTITTAEVGNVKVGDSITTVGGLNLNGGFDLSLFPTNYFDGLTPSSDSEGFTADDTAIDNGTGNWGLTFTMNLSGKINTLAAPNVVDSVHYDSGLIEVYLVREDGAGGIEAINAFDMNVTGSDPSNTSNFLVFGDIGFSGNEDAALADMFHLDGLTCLDPAGGTSFKELSECASPPITVTFVVDQNLNDATASFLGPNTAQLTGNHDGSVDFGAEIPEPATMLLLGGGLLGLGFTARRRRS